MIDRRHFLAKVPDGTRVYAIGDIHGRPDLLAQVLDKIDAHSTAYPIHVPIEVFLGDYVDRGPQSRAVVDMIMRRVAENPNVIALMGNHEDVFVRAVKDIGTFSDWMQYGGRETLLSYGIAVPIRAGPRDFERAMLLVNETIPRDHVEFLENLPLIYNSGDYTFVHAGLRPGVPLNKQRRQDMLWIRHEFLSYKDFFPVKVVHGHTLVRRPEILENRIGIDTGAFITGQLTCLVLEGFRVGFL